MCIIVAKEKKVGLPTIKQLQNCFDYNNDGAGFMYVKNGRVVIDKGYMTWKKFYKRYQKLCKKFNNFEGQALIMHFRIGTSSGNTPENTHPYPISNNVKDLHRTYTTTSLGMVHNGIISEYTPEDNLSKTNDTQEFILKYVSTLYSKYPTFYKDKYIMSGMEKITKSKLAFLDTSGRIYYVGDFITDNGVKFSNGTYEDWFYTPKYYDSKYFDSKYSFDKEELMPLESNWYVEYNDKWEEVGDRDMCWDVNSGALYEYIGGVKELISEDAIIFDEQYDYIF